MRSLGAKLSGYSLALMVSLCEAHSALGQPVPESATDRRVAVLIERMLRSETEQRAFADLEALGPNRIHHAGNQGLPACV
jgi:hypothetical protein